MLRPHLGKTTLRQAWYVSSLIIKFVTYQSSAAAHLALCIQGLVFNVSLRTPDVMNQHLPKD